MSKDLPESLTFKEDVNLYRYCNGNLNFSTVSHDDEDFVFQKKKIMRDPMSHRIIEKRRRDRMNNCLADLSRLIPPGYLKKGRGRIEKTEIIEMAIKHMRHLQNIISSSRIIDGQSEIQTGSSPERGSHRDSVAAQTALHQNPIVLEHYRLGYLECLSEAMHFLVEVQGYFAGDSLCVQMINHLHKHCDKILRSESLNHPRKHSGDTTSSTSSTSPPNGSYGDNSPPLGLSVSDDNQPNLPYENLQSPKRYSDMLSLKKSCNYSRYSEHEIERVSENHSDSDPEHGYSSNGRNREIREYVNGYQGSPTCSECLPKDCSSSSGIGSIPPPSDEFLVKEENGPSQLRDMLTSPRTLHIGHPIRDQEVTKISSPPPIFGCDVNRQSYGSRGSCPCPYPCPRRDGSHCGTDGPKNKNSEGENPGSKEFHHESAPDTSGNMYKFKNNIKQRFSKERKNHESDEEGAVKKPKLSESGQAREGPIEEDYKRCRFISESETKTEMEDISNRLSFGHKIAGRSKERPKYSKLPSPEIPIYHKPGGNGRKPERLLSINEYLPLKETLFHKNDVSEGTGIPIFALHAKGAFYIPLTLDHTVLAPFLPILGLTKSEEIEDKPVLHPISISVNFQNHFLSRTYRQSAIPWK